MKELFWVRGCKIILFIFSLFHINILTLCVFKIAWLYILLAVLCTTTIRLDDLGIINVNMYFRVVYNSRSWRSTSSCATSGWSGFVGRVAWSGHSTCSNANPSEERCEMLLLKNQSTNFRRSRALPVFDTRLMSFSLDVVVFRSIRFPTRLLIV